MTTSIYLSLSGKLFVLKCKHETFKLLKPPRWELEYFKVFKRVLFQFNNCLQIILCSFAQISILYLFHKHKNFQILSSIIIKCTEVYRFYAFNKYVFFYFCSTSVNLPIQLHLNLYINLGIQLHIVNAYKPTFPLTYLLSYNLSVYL